MSNARRKTLKTFPKGSVESAGKSKPVLEAEWNQHLLMDLSPISAHFYVVSRIFPANIKVWL